MEWVYGAIFVALIAAKILVSRRRYQQVKRHARRRNAGGASREAPRHLPGQDGGGTG